MRASLQHGFTLVEIMVVIAILGVLLAIAVPGYLRVRNVARGRAVQNDLEKIDSALQQYALDFDLDTTVGAPGPDTFTSMENLRNRGYFRTIIQPPVAGFTYELPATWQDYPFTTLCDAQNVDVQRYYHHPAAAGCDGLAP